MWGQKGRKDSGISGHYQEAFSRVWTVKSAAGWGSWHDPQVVPAGRGVGRRMEWEQGAGQRQWRNMHEWAERSQNMRGESTPGEQQFKKILL